MEFASCLAGERWSDHPACTHPLLAELARRVNDCIGDRSRQGLVVLVPDVIGLTGSDLRIDVRIALRAARTALPVVDEHLQCVLAVAVLGCERLLADLDDLDDRPSTPLSQQSRDALGQVPAAAAWAQRYTRDVTISRRVFRRQTAPAIVDYAVRGIAGACVPDPDPLLHDLLAGAIEDCQVRHAPDHPRPPATRAANLRRHHRGPQRRQLTATASPIPADAPASR